MLNHARGGLQVFLTVYYYVKDYVTFQFTCHEIYLDSKIVNSLLLKPALPGTILSRRFTVMFIYICLYYQFN